jgi:GNAT superfamily N-acetyltransferase
MMTDSEGTTTAIRSATPDDLPLIMELILGLAEYEKLADRVTATPELIGRALFSDRPYAECLIAETEGTAAGFAIFFHNFSTFLGKRGIYLEDLFVLPEFRGRGIGRALLGRLAAIAVERDAARLEWAVLDWNEPAIKFYRGLRAEMLDDWRIFRLTGGALADLAGEAD